MRSLLTVAVPEALSETLRCLGGTWRIMAVALLFVVLCCTVYGIIFWRQQFDVGFTVGCLGTLLVVCSAFVFLIAEDSLLARLARF